MGRVDQIPNPGDYFAAQITRVNDSILSIELRGANDEMLPAFSAGAHISLYLPNHLVRSYSLTNDEKERDRYVIAVARAPESRGGSAYIHEQLRVGDLLSAGQPRNNFPLAATPGKSIFIAGGIGITPCLSMMRRANHCGMEWELYYCARSKRSAAFLQQICELAREGGKVTTHFKEEQNGARLCLGEIVAAASASAHFYCCGPSSMLNSFKEVCRDVPDEQVHLEYFNQSKLHDPVGGFIVQLARQNRSIYVPDRTTILDALLAEGIDAPFACREGICGTCEVAVLKGEPVHRDSVLSPDERAQSRTMMICCSGSRTPLIILDL